MPTDMLEYTAHEYGWRACVPEELGRFYKLPLFVDVHTRHIPSAPETLPEIHASQKALVSAILDRLGQIVADAEIALRGWHENAGIDFETIAPRLSEPRIWIRLEDTENLRKPAPRRDNKWTLVVGVEGAPDFGYHIEFDLDELLEVWAGD